MQKTITLIFDGAVFRPETPVELEPNTRWVASIEREPESAGGQALWDALAGHVGSVEGPEDWSAEHDHYLYGTPRRGPEGGDAE